MAHWTDPYLVLYTLHFTTFVLCGLLGVLVWETVTTLRLDWAVVAGKQRFTAAYIPYALARVMGIASLFASIIATKADADIDCSAWAMGGYVCAYISTISADGISLLRTIAVSLQNKWVVGIMGSVYAALVTFMTYELTKLRFLRVPSPLDVCLQLPGNKERHIAVGLALLAFDVLSLSFFIFILRLSGPSKRGLWRLLYHQGVVWFVLIAATHTAGMTMLVLDLNQPIDVLAQMVTMMVIVICATRMHRSLIDYCTRCSYCSRLAGNSAEA